MRICFICVEIFAWGKYGGFGRATRVIGRELAKRGIEVFAIVPRRKDQKLVEGLDGITVLSFPAYSPLNSIGLYRRCDADIYHSQEPSLSTYLAMRAMPRRKHIITLRDIRDLDDWKKEFYLPSRNRLQVLFNYLYEDNFLTKKAVRNADRVFCASEHLIRKGKTKYGSNLCADFLPTPVNVPLNVNKAKNPTVCFLSRFDRRKRPEIFFDVVKKFPDVDFIAIGKSQDRSWDSGLRRTYSNLPNLELTGFIDQFNSELHSRILEKSWILMNTSTREGLPNSFLEAAAHRCAILSAVDPDGFASRFGFHVTDGDFVKGLKYLLENLRWKERGNYGYIYVNEFFEVNRAIDRHVAVYEQVLES